MEASYGSLAAQASHGRRTPAGSSSWPRSSRPALPPQQQAGPRGFFETLFGPPRGARPVPPQGVPEGMPDPMEAPDAAAGRRAPAARRPPPRLRAHLRRLLLPPRQCARRARERRRDVPGPLPRRRDPGLRDAGLRRRDQPGDLAQGRPYASLPKAFKFQKSLRRRLRLQEGRRELGDRCCGGPRACSTRSAATSS